MVDLESEAIVMDTRLGEPRPSSDRESLVSFHAVKPDWPDLSVRLFSAAWALSEHSIFDAQDLAGFDVDQQGVGAVAHPYIAVGRVHQSEIPVAGQPITTAPE
jgi:hypothetical protein